MTKTHIKAIIFDLGAVLINWDPKLLYRKMFADEKEMNYFLEEVCPMEWNATLDAGYSFAQGVQDRIELYPDYEPYIRAWHERWPEMVEGAINGTVTILEQLIKEGYTVFALSNWSAETYPLVAAQFEFLQWFEHVVLSGQEKVIKPNPEIYHRLLNRIEYSPEECLFIDDSKPNIEAANALGIQTIHFTSPQALATTLKDRQILA